jgi:glycosyltransferase involved in cell wall biosynthesis
MSVHPTFNVIVPTRERAETLYHTLRSIVEQDYENLRIIISDNFSQDNTKDVVASLADHRIEYINTGNRMSMSENFEYSLNHVHDGFVMFVGDDDGLLPGAIRRVCAIVNETGSQAVASGAARYVWPNHPVEELRNKISWSIRKDTEIRSSSEWINRVLSFEPPYTFDLPGLYCGFVHTDVVSSMKKDGVFFRSQTPDAYSAFACAAALTNYAFSHRPFAIHGASGRSNGASYFHNIDRSESQSFFKENTIPFHPMLRVCPSFRVIAAEAFLQFRDAFPEKTSQYKFDLTALLSAALGERAEHTRARIDLAVAEMATTNGIDMKDIIKKSHALLPKIRNGLQQLPKQLPLRARYSGIPDASKIGVFNVYDAAKTMAVLFALNDGVIISRYRSIVNKLFKVFRHH